MPLHSVLDVADPDGWLVLDAAVRGVAWNRPQFLPEWEHSAPLPADLTQLGESRLALALCHRDGRIRQKAVRQSARFPGLLPLVVVRCADWAGPVREQARQVLREALDVDSALGLTPIILRVGRRDRGAFGVDVLGQVLRKASHGQLAVLFAHPDRTVRRLAYRLAIEGRLLGPAELARAAARDQDNVVQDLCATAALAALGDEDAYEDVLPPLLSARNPRTRSAGVTALRRAGRSQQAETFLSDRSALVRACARYVVRQQGSDPAAWYRQRCRAPDDPELQPGAVIGLAECGNRADAGLLRPFLAHPVAGVRARAVAGLRVLDCADAEQLRPLLDDPAAGVVRETASALEPSAKDLPADWLLKRTGSEWPRHIRLGAFRLLDACGGVVALRAAVGLLEDPDVKLRTWAAQSVQRWHPSPVGRRGDAEVGELLDRSRHLFSDHVLRRRKWEAGLESRDSTAIRDSAQPSPPDIPGHSTPGWGSAVLFRLRRAMRGSCRAILQKARSR
ncbi:HEAT repeat domain-containing protein [Streptomyces sp. NPDC006784]|uniref:HEAT repeat domain-containing protein n=1 Tax=Streptomyces sp. NPDC006784 TaxID=3364764 RepID=UPI00367CA4FC